MNFRPYTPEDLARFFEQLRIKGIAKLFEERFQEAMKQDTGTLDFLGTLLSEELLARKQRRFERFIHAGNLDMNDCIENYDFDLAKQHGVDPKMVRDLASASFIPAHQNIILAGPVGTGKTQLARTLCLEAIRRGYRAVFENTRDLIEELFLIRNSLHFPKVYKSYVNADILALDDLAYMPFDPEKVDFLFRLVFDQTEKKNGALIITTNSDVRQWWQYFPNKAMGMAFSDRALGGALGIKFTGDSIRRRKDKDTK